MYIDLAGQWHITLTADDGLQQGEITLPGSLQKAGYGNPIKKDTPFVSGLHDAFWYEQEPFKKGVDRKGEEACLVPFLCQPVRHFLGEAVYERTFTVKEENVNWILRMELTRWRTKVWIDGEYKGEDCSLCTAHEIPCGKLSAGEHRLKVAVDNSMQYPYRPDGHGVSDALGATWNGIAGEILLLSEEEMQKRQQERAAYAKAHPRKMESKDGNFYVDGAPFYFRATHFGGEYPETGYPATDIQYWKRRMQTIKSYGLNSIRCHSYCPPEAAFQAADEEDVLLLVECDMWNTFNEGIQMLEVLRKETERVLRQFGHHPSFAFFSPSNEPGGNWYQPLRDWVRETRKLDEALGYAGRRLYTAESGWFYDVEPSKVTGTDFLYFHRSNFGPIAGGSIRNAAGWRGGNYTPSVEGAKLPVICHELGQWCAYPDFRIIDKMKGYLRPGNFQIFKEIAEESGLLSHAEDFLWCSGRNQIRLYKEELEANFRTPELKGFELLDIHDYAGQGTALVGFLDVMWQNKGYVTPQEFQAFCGDTVLLLRCPSYVWKQSDCATLPVEVSHFGKTDLQQETLLWTVTDEAGEVFFSGELTDISVARGTCQEVGTISLDFAKVSKSSTLTLKLQLGACSNQWQLTVFAEPKQNRTDVLYSRSWQETKEALQQGKTVVFAPQLSELSYECPALSIKNVFWNGQMGPAWIRSLGIVAQPDHPIWQEFPTGKDGGWKWEDILDHARGFWLKDMEEVEPVVRPIDDWNRSLSLGLLYEAKAANGKLFFVSADLEGSFEERPAAYCLKQAILNYASSEAFSPKAAVSLEAIEEKLFPVCRMESLGVTCSYDAEALVKGEDAILQANPNVSLRIEKEAFPVTITLTTQKPLEVQGLLYLPEQKDRAHEGFIRDYRIEYFRQETKTWEPLKTGQFLNTSLSQKVMWEETIFTKQIRVVVLSCYGCVDKTIWTGTREGWIQVEKKADAVVQAAGLQLICKEAAQPSDKVFWAAAQKSSTKEIDN